MAFCQKCGAEYSPDQRFCERCGSQLAAIVPYESNVAVPQAPVTVNNSKAAVFTLPPGKTVSGIKDTVSSMLSAKNMDVQVIEPEDGGFVVQTRAKGGNWKQFVGMDVALNVIIKQTGDKTVSMEFSQTKWTENVGKRMIGMFVIGIPILALTSGIGAYMQVKLPNEIKNAAMTYLCS